MNLRLHKFCDGKLSVVSDLDIKSDGFKSKFIQTCNRNKNWEHSVAVTLDDCRNMTFVNTHAEYCKEMFGIEYTMKELLFNKHTRYMCFIEIDNKTKQIFYGCASRRSKALDIIQLLAIQLEYELYEIKYNHEATLLSLSDPCIPGVGSTRLIYTPYVD